MKLYPSFAVATVALAGAGALALPSCSPLVTKQIAKGAIDVAVAACISENADIADEPALREVCKWTDDMAPLVKDLLSARSRGLGKARAACAPGSVKP